jgi:cysteine sulfinate desulfinase/cysteine desulfurase-like protein
MQSNKRYFLDTNTNPNFFDKMGLDCLLKLRSGNEESIDKLKELNSYFSNRFGHLNSSFFDFSPYSIYKLLKIVSSNQNSTIAVSSKVSHFVYEGVLLAQETGIKIVFVEVDKNGFLDIDSLKKAKEIGAEFLVCSLVDEDVFLIENMKEVNKYFANTQIIADISNALSLDIPKDFNATFLWGHKLGCSKNSGVLMHDFNEVDFIDRVDLREYDRIQKSLENLQVINQETNREYFIKMLKDNIGESFDILVDTTYTLNNSFCAIFKGIKARDLIRTLALENIFVTNGEYCSLGLSKPSRIFTLIQKGDVKNHEVLSISFDNLTKEEISYLAKRIALRYLQIRAIG